MKKSFLSLFLVLCFAANALAQDNPDRVIASTKDWSITARQFEAIVSALPEQAREVFAQPGSRRKFLDDIIQMWVLAAEARSQGFDKDVSRQAVIGFYTNNIVSSDYKDSLSQTGEPSAADIAAFYKANEASYTELSMSHIMILNAESPQVKERNMEGALPPAEARKKLEDIRSRVVAGGDFAALAKEFSQDKGSAEKGGAIGPISAGTLVPDMEKAAFALKPGETSVVVESPVAFHILQVSDRHVKDLAEVTPEIREKMMATRLNDGVAARIKSAAVVIDESYFKN